MIVQVLADTGKIVHDGKRPTSSTAPHLQLRSARAAWVELTAPPHTTISFARVQRADLPALLIFDADRAFAFEYHAERKRAGFDAQGWAASSPA